MTEQTLITIDTLMEQAQVFASAWSLVGGKFDSGDQLESAEDEKSLLEEMVEAFEEQLETAANNAQLKEIAEGLIAWHQQRIKNIDTVLDAPTGTTIQLGKDDTDPIILKGELRKGFRMGLIIAKEWFENFPLSIDRAGSTDNDTDEEE